MIATSYITNHQFLSSSSRLEVSKKNKKCKSIEDNKTNKKEDINKNKIAAKIKYIHTKIRNKK